MERLTTLRRKMLATCLVVAATSLMVVAVALADEVFQPRAWVGPFGEGKHSASGLVDIIQGEGWQYESCVDIALEGGGYAAKHCNGAGNFEQSEPHNNGYARVWNAKGGNNEIWGWARF
ncbi:MAG TPA: hypothetical protein VGI76_07230 [Solirubrobacteraceae bacterium]